MVVGIGRISVVIHDTRSLKEKRRVLKSIITRVRGRFNVAIAEVGGHDLWQRAELGLAAVGGDRAFINSVVEKTINYIEDLHLVEIIGHDIEMADF